MDTHDSSSPIREGMCRTLQNDLPICLLIFFAAIMVRLIFLLQNPHPNGFLIYRGSPVSDGATYTFKAISIAEGQGIPSAQQPALRPFYPITLACLYTWCGFSLRAVTFLNIVIAGFTAALIYLCGARAFNRLCGLGAALFFAIDPSQLIQTPQAGTEPLGLLFFVASVYSTLRAFETHRTSLFLLSGLLIGLSNLTRTLTIFTLPFYAGLILFVGWRGRGLKHASLQASVLVLGFAIVTIPWLMRQHRLYGIWSISDNIGEAIYAATSPTYQQWTPSVRRDADADGIPNTVGDRYRYFIHRAKENLRNDPGFYLRNVGGALWEYANTFSPRSRATNRYAERFSNANKSQTVFLICLLVLLILLWLLREGRPLARDNLVFLLVSVGLLLLYRSLPAWLAFLPIGVGAVYFWRSGRTLTALIVLGSLVMAILGSVIFANPTLFRAILITDWLFILFFLAAILFPAEATAKQFGIRSKSAWFNCAGELNENNDWTSFQHALARRARHTIWFALGLILTFFAISSVRLLALTVSKPGRIKVYPVTQSAKIPILHRLQQPPFEVVPAAATDFPLFNDWAKPRSALVGQYIVESGTFKYSYYIPAGTAPPRGRSADIRPYGRTLIILSEFDFNIAGELPEGFAQKPLILVGRPLTGAFANKLYARLQVDGLAVIPMDRLNRPDYKRAVCAPNTIGAYQDRN